MNTPDVTNVNPQHKEGKIAKSIEAQTAKIPSDVFLWASFASMAASAIMQFTNKKKESFIYRTMGSSFPVAWHLQ